MAYQYPVVVIGGGIIGLSIALSVQANGTDVLLIDKHEIGSGASFGNAGHIATEQVFPIADPAVLKSIPKMLLDPLGPLRLDWRYLLPLTPWLCKLVGNMRHKPFTHIHRTLTTLNRAAFDSWQTFIQKWQLSDLVKMEGSLLVAEKNETLDKLGEHSEYLTKIGVKNQLIQQAELLQREPALSTSQLGGIFYPDTGHVIDLAELHSRLTQSFINLGGRVLTHCEVTQITSTSNLEATVTTTQGVFSGRKVVIAGGAFSKSLVRMVSRINVPLETERGYHLMLPQEGRRLNIPVSSMDRRFIMTPMAGGLRLAGTVEYAGLKRPPNMQRAHHFLPLAEPMLTTPLNSQESTPWMGFRPSTSDSLPVIDHKGPYIFAFGHQHLGLTQAAITADIVNCFIHEQPTAVDCSPFSIERFL
ncbi:FAD-binding oxidoreductase [Providencia rettgeri]|uniref:FAD-dependent oxidoreductase n=1 Tax=Providencia huashanensis TaxID=3037798 RepID=A0AA42FHI0_9GAMM|nr:MULTISPECIES: FAD-dependent oxidoreductase [Providencia]EIL1982119.1 FAD-binding oxidoreductase [Providencia rettgeri]EIU7555171.1 FAD-binding oxidoreductase [Providencia rettgeri]EIU9513742.1 FAD-binding oxidoreductase [Providencia rettgeri]EJD6080915.1 FAD-binding oxidoreductase [Providencia rettgeri]EJD6370447.1 FAD-binding oxidoreductase [Providencia rettgeri]